MNEKSSFECEGNYQEITSMTVHYKSNCLDGFLIIVKIQDEPNRRAILEMMDAYQGAWAKASDLAKREQVSRYLSQVKKYAKSGGTRSASPMSMLVVFNIWFLEKHGYLASDAFNGCIFS
jgi:hypothetical protein